MDDAQQSRTSDAATTRKRRSSILKSQRAPRAPLSELEFHVATPTDTAKSRRVSFSRRTGVAEFVTNEATTTWKNFYEEHNKSLESSGNESAAHQPRASVGHLGKRIFEDQFQEVEVIDFGSCVNDSKGVETSINNVKFDQFSLECTADDRKLAATGQNFEFSTFTVSEQSSKLFADDLAISGLGEITDKINVNYSTMQPIGDDLDEIQKDLERQQSNPQNILCPGPPSGRNMSGSGYIEIDLNCTRIALVGEIESISDDMSITDTIHSPKVNVSKNSVCEQIEKSLNKDWVADKENIAVNPYVAPKESANFAINEDSDKILIFDGKRLTFQSEKGTVTDYRKTLIPTAQPDKPPQRKTIVLNVDDDLPNFISNPLTSMSHHSNNFSLNETALGNDSEISMTQSVPASIETKSVKRQTIVFENSCGNISMTQVLPTNIAIKKDEKRVTIVFDDDADISITQVVPTNVIIPKPDTSKIKGPSEKRKTLVFDDESGNISMTQALSTNMILGRNEYPVPNERTVIYDVDSGDISETRILPSSVPPELNKKRNALVFNDEEGNTSLTQVIRSNIVLEEIEGGACDITGHTSSLQPEEEKRKTLLFSNEDGNISVTRLIPSDVLLLKDVNKQHQESLEKSTASLSLILHASEKRKTIVFNDEDGNISMTRPIPSDVLIFKDVNQQQQESLEKSTASPSLTPPASEKRKTIVFNDQDDNISMTRPISSNVLLSKEVSQQQQESLEKSIASLSLIPAASEKRNTIVFNDRDGNISFTTAIPSNQILADRVSHGLHDTVSIVATCKDENKSMTNDFPSNIVGIENGGLLDQVQYSGKSAACLHSRPKIYIAYEDYSDIDISMTQVLPSNIISSEKETFIYNSDADKSITPTVPANVTLPENNLKASNETKNLSLAVTDMEEEHESVMCKEHQRPLSAYIINNEALQPKLEEPTNMDFLSEQKDISVTQTALTNFNLSERLEASVREKTILCENNTDEISATTAVVPENIDTFSNKDDISKHEDIQNLEEQTRDASMTKVKEETVNTQQNHTKDFIKGESDTSEIVLNLTSGFISDHKGNLNMLNSNTKTLFDAAHLRNVVVYQNINCPRYSFVERPKLEQESVLSTISSSNGQVESEEDRTDSENIFKAEYVTVSHRIPLHSADMKTETEITIPVTNSDTIIPISSSSTSSQDILNAPAVCPETTSLIVPTMKENKSTKQSCSDISYKLIQSHSAIREIQQNIEKTLLENLLDMDTGSGIVDKSVTAEICGYAVEKTQSKSSTNSADDLFFITRDSDHNTQTNKSINEGKKDNTNESSLKPQLMVEVPGPTQLTSESEVNIVVTGPTRPTKFISESEESIVVKDPTKNRYVDKDIVTDLKYKDFIDADADDTKEILDMISQYTEKDEAVIPVKEMTGTCIVALEKNKVGGVRRPSMPITQEELFSNISRAQAALRSAGVGSEPDDTLSPPLPKKNVRRNSEVVKTLRFEDEESFSDPKDDPTFVLTSPLKKNPKSAWGTTCEESKKGNVIPSYLKDVSDGIKSLMTDLVKPMVDEMPFLASKGAGAEAGTGRILEQKKSCDAQANLCTSSQIDLPQISPFKSLKSIIKPYFDNSNETPSESSSSTTVQSTAGTTSESSESSEPGRAVDQSVPGGAIPFDPRNPLNNVLLFSPVHFNEVHKYDPVKKPSPEIISVHSQEKVSKSSSRDSENHSQKSLSKNPSKQSLSRVHNVSFNIDSNNKLNNTQYNVHRVIPDFLEPASLSLNKTSDIQNPVAPIVKGTMTDRSVETINSVIKDEGINTDICMQDNKKLVEYSSSLTVVNSTMQEEPHSKPQSAITPTLQVSHVEVIYKQNASSLEEKMHSEDIEVTKKTDKRKLKKSVQSALDATPTPAAKVAKQSPSPSDDGGGVRRVEDPRGASSVEEMSSGSRLFPASNDPDMGTLDIDSFSEEGGGLEWRPSLLHEPSSKDMVAARDSAADVAAMLQRLPFMGSNDCAWESATDDEWSFCLLRARLRLTVRLARPRVAAPRRARRKHSDNSVRGNTPVAELQVEQVEDVPAISKKNAAAFLCVQFALQAMRRVCSLALESAGGEMRAGALAGALRGCVGVARAAHCWAEAMHHAWAHLAYTLMPDGHLTLTVANIALRCVWEVSLRVEMRAGHEQEAPCPLARCVLVSCVVGTAPVSPREVTRALFAVPEDWGHAPRSLWKIFRYLKNKQVPDVL